MKKKDSRTRAVALGALMMASLTPCGGCVPTDSGGFVTFLRDLLSGAVAAFML